jgi:hypothetical protein
MDNGLERIWKKWPLPKWTEENYEKTSGRIARCLG